MSRYRPLPLSLAIVFLIVLLGSLAARFWAVNEAVETGGPTHIAADADHVVLFAGGDLYRLSVEGELLESVPMSRIGLEDDPIDLLLLSDGNLLVALQRPARALSCDLPTWSCRPVARAATEWIERQFKLLPGTAPGEWLATDARGDALWRLLPDTAPHAVLRAGTLAGPNGLADAGGGVLWVADTDHRRIVEILPSGDGSYGVGREHGTANGVHTAERWFPMMLTRAADDRWWVTQAAEFAKGGADLLVYDADQGPLARISLPENAYPTDLIAVADSVLVTDMDGFEVYRVDVETRLSLVFGDDRFRSRMADLRAKRVQLETVSSLALVGVIAGAALMLGAAVWATPRSKRWTPTPQLIDWDQVPERTPRTAGIHWLERHPAIERSLRWAPRIAYGLVLLPAAVLLGLWFWMQEQAGPEPAADIGKKLDELGVAMIVVVLLAALLVPIIRLSLRAMSACLGTDGRRLFIRRHDGREMAAGPQNILYTDRMILYREYSLPLVGGNRHPIYQPGEVETWLGPLLREARRISAMEAMKHQWRHGGSRQFAWMFVAVTIAGVLIAALGIP